MKKIMSVVVAALLFTSACNASDILHKTLGKDCKFPVEVKEETTETTTKYTISASDLYGDASFITDYINGSYEGTNFIYVKAGAKGGDGSESKPYSSVNKAVKNAKPGDTILVHGGEYKENIYIENSGKAGAYITLKAFGDEKPVIVGTNKNDTPMLDFGGSSYICVDGLEFSGYTAKWCYAMYMGGGENHIIIKNNNIHDIKCTQPDNPDNSGANGILLFGETKEPVSNVVIADNYIHDLVTGWCEALSITSNCEYINVLGNRVENNTNIGIDFYGNNADGYCPYEELNQPRYCTAIGNEVSNCICDYAECAGIYVDGARDIVVKQNISHDNQSGIEVGSEERNENYPVKNVYVLDNYVYNNKKGIVVGGWNDTETSEDKLSGIVYDTTVKGNKVECDNGINLNIAMVDGLIVEGNEFVNTGRGGVVSSDVKTETVKNVKFKGNRYVTSVGVKFD